MLVGFHAALPVAVVLAVLGLESFALAVVGIAGIALGVLLELDVDGAGRFYADWAYGPRWWNFRVDQRDSPFGGPGFQRVVGVGALAVGALLLAGAGGVF